MTALTIELIDAVSKQKAFRQICENDTQLNSYQPFIDCSNGEYDEEKETQYYDRFEDLVREYIKNK